MVESAVPELLVSHRQSRQGQVDRAHDVRRIEAEVSQLLGTRREYVVQVVADACGDLQIAVLPRRAVMHTSGRHQMAHVVELVVVQVLPTIEALKLDPGRKVSIRLLRLGDPRDGLVHQ